MIDRHLGLHRRGGAFAGEPPAQPRGTAGLPGERRVPHQLSAAEAGRPGGRRFFTNVTGSTQPTESERTPRETSS
jgi:hypothetical protein